MIEARLHDSHPMTTCILRAAQTIPTPPPSVAPRVVLIAAFAFLALAVAAYSAYKVMQKRANQHVLPLTFQPHMYISKRG